MVLGIYFAYSVDDGALLVYDVGGAEGAHTHLAVVLLLAPSLVGLEDGEVGVGNEVEWERVFLNETAV